MVVKEIKLGILIAALCGVASISVVFAYDALSGTAPLLIVIALIVFSALVLELAALPKKAKELHPALPANVRLNPAAVPVGRGGNVLGSEWRNLPAAAQLGNRPAFNQLIAGISSRQSLGTL